ncbi:MAG: NAD(P)H-dependent oxidoreductase subunit E [Anaerolineales bacterium]|nr:NAD(P)H-dependent oxidoreductase subunit E [Anaerolineales bacterium]
MTPSTLDPQPLHDWLALQGSADRSRLLPMLIEAQRLYGYLSEQVLAAVGQTLRVPLAEVHGVVRFYTLLYDRPTGRTIVRVCTSPRCAQAGGEQVLRDVCLALGVQPGEPTSDWAFEVEEVACLCLCDHAPAALLGDVPVGHLQAVKPEFWLAQPQEIGLGHIGGSPRRLTARCHEGAPAGLSEYVASGGFSGLERALRSLSPAGVIEVIEASGLEGRGGAAFPTGQKWSLAASGEARRRYVVCNGDESEPGTFKDRVLLEGDPWAVLEGMAIAGYAIGAERGYLYIRGEYPRAQRILQKAIREAQQAGYLGENILGSDFHFEIELRSGAGAYICGEETALLESIEGKRGLPRLKPPYPVTDGLFGQPTAINNVETLCTATWILSQGVEAFRSVGTPDSPGTKLFCLSGDVALPGTYEVAFGTPLRELVATAGGVAGELQAVLLGGAAGAFAGPEVLELPLSYEGFRQAGLPLGSGVLMVINAERDLRQTCWHLSRFFAHESCGKCFPCQLGTQRQMEIIRRGIEGTLTAGDLEALDDVAYTMTQTSICGLGVTASSAIESARKRWPELFRPGAA